MKDSNCASFHKSSEHKSHSYGEVPNLELGDPVRGHVQPVQLQQGVEEGPLDPPNLKQSTN